jgi:hypothetical protein
MVVDYCQLNEAVTDCFIVADYVLGKLTDLCDILYSQGDLLHERAR